MLSTGPQVVYKRLLLSFENIAFLNPLFICGMELVRKSNAFTGSAVHSSGIRRTDNRCWVYGFPDLGVQIAG